MLNLTGLWVRPGTLATSLLAALCAHAGTVCAAPQNSEPDQMEAYIIGSKQVKSIALDPKESDSAMTPLEQMHQNIVHNNVESTKAGTDQLNASESKEQLANDEQLNNLITRPIVVCDHPDQLSHVILNRRYFNSIPEQYLQEVEADLNTLAQHNSDFKARLQAQDSPQVQRIKRNEFEAMLLQDYAQRRSQSKSNVDELMSNYFADELTYKLHLESLRPENQSRRQHQSNVQRVVNRHGTEVAHEAEDAASVAEHSINTPLKLKLKEMTSHKDCQSDVVSDPQITAQSMAQFKAAAAAPDPERYILEHGISDIICAEGCTHHNPMHSTITPYFTYVTACCWNATVPPTVDNNEFYVLFSNDCLNTQVEINILPHSQYTLPFLAQHVFTTLKEGERNHSYSNVQLTVHHHGYLITYEVLGVANAHFLTTSGDDITMVVITGDLITGVDYVNTFKRADGNVLPQLMIPEVTRNRQQDTGNQDLTLAQVHSEDTQPQG